MKDSEEVIREFNGIVNMTASELEKWLKSGDSNSAGWPKEDESGESVGHDSGRKIVEILKSNPKKEPKKYTDDQVQHMRKVVSYCKRHLAQEKKVNEEKSDEEVKKTKSYASLKNWGHDFLKAKEEGGDDEGGDEPDDDANIEDEDAEQETEDKKTGDKRKKDSGDQKGSKKKQETTQARTTRSKKQTEDDEEEDGNDEAQINGKQTNSQVDEDGDGGEDEDEESGGQNGKGGKAKNGPDPGDEVSWKWGAGHPKGKVLDVKEDKATITTKRGNQVSRHGDEKDPAVVLDTGKSKAVKSAHELD